MKSQSPDRFARAGLVSTALGGLVLTASLTNVLADALFVDPGNPSAFAQIQEAIDAAAEGDEILVREGIYDPIAINKNDLSIRAVGNDEVIIQVNPTADIPGGCLDLRYWGGLVSPCASAAEPGVTLNADGVTIKGLTVTGARGYGMLVTGDGNTLQDNVVENTSAVAIDSDFDGNIDDYEATDVGIRLAGAHHNTLIGNTARGNGGRVGVDYDLDGTIDDSWDYGHGIELQGSHDNTLIGNTAQDNARWGVNIIQSDDNKIVNNSFTGNVNGIEVSATSAFNTVQANRASGNNNGFVLGGGVSNTLHGNVAEANNFRGFFLIFGSDENVLEGNTARKNGREGFLLLFGADSNILRGNVSEGNGAGGVVLYVDTDKNTLQGNIAKDNAGVGFGLVASTFNTLQANTASDNTGDGFYLESSDANTLKSNTARRNAGWGFFVDALLANEFQNNHGKLNGLGDANLDGVLSH